MALFRLGFPAHARTSGQQQSLLGIYRGCSLRAPLHVGSVGQHAPRLNVVRQVSGQHVVAQVLDHARIANGHQHFDNLPTMLVTSMFSLMPGSPGRKQQIPRTRS